jgi:glycosyltransferase involved in cell wall biosynthesis
MEIVHELNQLEYGGVERVIENIIRYDDKNSHTIAAYQDGPFKSVLEEAGAKVVLLSEEDVDLAADVIHVHSGGAKSPLAYDIKGKFPVIETIHSPVRSANSDKVITQRIGVSKTVSNLNKACATIYNGIDIKDNDIYSEMYPEVNSIPAHVLGELNKANFIIGRLGRIGKDKGLEEWLLTCYYLQQIGYNFTPLIIGGEALDSEGYIGKLKLMAKSLPVKNIIFAGPSLVPGDYYPYIDIFLYPSATEGFGLVIAEALLNSRCVVTYNTEVNMELFGGYACFSKLDEGVPGLVKSVEKCINEVQYRNELEGLGHDFIASEYQVETMVKEYQEHYERCYGNFNRKNKS